MSRLSQGSKIGKRNGFDNRLRACVTRNTLPSPGHKELHRRRVFLDLAPLDLTRNPRHAVVRTIGI